MFKWGRWQQKWEAAGGRLWQAALAWLGTGTPPNLTSQPEIIGYGNISTWNNVWKHLLPRYDVVMKWYYRVWIIRITLHHQLRARNNRIWKHLNLKQGLELLSWKGEVTKIFGMIFTRILQNYCGNFYSVEHLPWQDLPLLQMVK